MPTVIDKIRPTIQGAAEDLGYQIVDIEYVREGKSWFLRVYADKEGGINLDDCVHLSDALSQALDQMDEDPFPKDYYLEVSSPGAERPLRTEDEIAAAVGSYVHFDYYVHQHGELFHEGTLLNITDDGYELEIQEKSRKKVIYVKPDAVSKARLAVKF